MSNKDATAVSHILICVSDLDRSLTFHRNILGMRVAADRIQDTATGCLLHVYKHPRRPRRRVRLMFCQHDTSPTIAMTSHSGDSPDGESIKLDQIGISHISFSVPGVKALPEELISPKIPEVRMM